MNYGYFGKLVSLGQKVRQELDVTLPKKMEAASPAEQKKLVAMEKDMAAFNDKYERTRRDVFRAGMRMLGIQSSYTFEDRAILPGLPFNAYQWVVSDVESTEAASFAIVAAQDTRESLAAVDGSLDTQLAEPRKRARESRRDPDPS